MNKEERETKIAKLYSEKDYERKECLGSLNAIFDSMNEEESRDFVEKLKNVPKQSLEMQAQISRVLGCILTNIGGEKYIKLLLDTLKDYCFIDDFDVREKAVLSIERLSSQVSKETISNHFIPLFIEMSKAEFYGIRCAAGILICSTSKHFSSEDASKTINILIDLAKDEKMEVRKSVSETLKEAVQSKVFSEQTMKEIIETLSHDISSLVCSAVVESLVFISDKEFVEKIVKFVWETKKWQNRVAVLEIIEKLNLESELIANISEDSFNDVEVYVRKAATKQMKFFVLHKTITSEIILKLSHDEEKQVRVELAKAIATCGNELEKCDAALTTLLNDKENEVKLKALEAVAETGISIDTAVDKLNELANSGLWRTKKDAAMVIPKAASTMTKETFNEKLFPILENLMRNNVTEVRTTSVEATVTISKYYGSEWYDEKITPIVIEFFGNKNFSYRQTAIHAACTSPFIQKFEQQLSNAANDSCSNVRMVLAKELPLEMEEIMNKLRNDKDEDVSYIANNRKM